MIGSRTVYHCCAVESSGEGPYAFTVRCLGCAPDEESHLPGCDRVFGYGVLLPGGKVDLVVKGEVTRYESCWHAHEDLYYDYAVDFKWGPSNPEAGLTFY